MDEDRWDGTGYLLEPFDSALLDLARQALTRCFESPETSWAKKVSIGKLLHVYSRLPARSSSINVEVTIFSARYTSSAEEEVYFMFSLGASEEQLTIRLSGRYYHPATGGDSFTVLLWSADPENEVDFQNFTSDLLVVSSLIDPMEALRDITATPSMSNLEIEDDENDLLNDEPLEEDAASEDSDELADTTDGEEQSAEDSNDEVEPPRNALVTPVTAADRALLARLSPQQMRMASGHVAYGVEVCDSCRMDLSEVGLFVDGRSPSGAWGNYCSACALAHGIAIGWGSGQLYARQPDGVWCGIAGFRA